MRIHLKTVMVVGLVVLLVPLVLSYVGGIAGAGGGFTLEVKDHKNSNSINNATCNGCHDKTAEDPSTDAQYPGAHRRHLISAKLKFWNNGNGSGCGKCHQETVYGGVRAYKDNSGNLIIDYTGLGANYEGDLSYTDTDTPNTNANYPRAIRKQVKPGVCRSCHGKFNTNVAGSVHNGVDPKNPSCTNTGCHDSTSTISSQHSAATYINTAYLSNTYCGLCHGAFQWFQATETSEALP